MPDYPKLDPKRFEYLPGPFKEVILHDAKMPRVPDVIKFEDIPHYLEEYETWNETKQRLIQGCENVIREMKKGGQ